MANASRLDSFYSLVRSEFLLYSDLRGRSKPAHFWALMGSFAAYLVFLLVVDSLLLVKVLSFEVEAVVFWVLAAPLVVAIVPILSSWVRRAKDTQPVRRFDAWIANFSANSRVNQRLLQTIVLVTLFLVAAILAINYILALLAIFLIIAALPSDAVVHRKGPNASRSTTTLLPPPPPSSAFSVGAPPHLTPVASSAAPRFTSDIQAPSKDLRKRVWFWISVLIALLLILMALFPTLLVDIEKGIKRVTEPTQTVQPVESPTPSETPSGVPSETPTDATGTDSESVGGGVSGSEEDDDLVVVPVTPGDDKEVNSGLDPRFRYCTHAIAAGYGPYYNGVDPEYEWYNDRDGDGVVCER